MFSASPTQWKEKKTKKEKEYISIRRILNLCMFFLDLKNHVDETVFNLVAK